VGKVGGEDGEGEFEQRVRFKVRGSR
jgi:hypothetical protein